MSWLRLDDAMGTHRKTRRLVRGDGGLEAFGLHALALLHCSQYLTDGYVEPEFVEETLDDAGVRGKRRDQVIAALVAGGQWLPIDGGGWTVHDYLEHNPSRDQVEQRRAKDTERKAVGRRSQSASRPRGHDADGARTARGVHDASGGPTPASHPIPSKTPPAPPTGGRSRARERWESQALEWAQATAGVTGPEDHLLSAVERSKPWQVNGDSTNVLRDFAAQWYPNTLVLSGGTA